MGADTLRGTLQVAHGVIFSFFSDDEKITNEITIEILYIVWVRVFRTLSGLPPPPPQKNFLTWTMSGAGYLRHCLG